MIEVFRFHEVVAWIASLVYYYYALGHEQHANRYDISNKSHIRSFHHCGKDHTPGKSPSAAIQYPS